MGPRVLCSHTPPCWAPSALSHCNRAATGETVEQHQISSSKGRGTRCGHTNIAVAELSPIVCQPSMRKFSPSNPRPSISFQPLWWKKKKGIKDLTRKSEKTSCDVKVIPKLKCKMRTWEPGGNARERLEPSPMQGVCLIFRPMPKNLHQRKRELYTFSSCRWNTT